MEAAGTALAEAVAGLAPQGPVRILCGKGNNGGDGLVAARRLARDGLRGRGARDLRRRGLPADLDAWLAGSGASSTRSSAPASRAPRASRRRPRSRRPTAAARRSSPATSPPGSTPRPARSRGSRSRRRSRSAFHAAKLGHRVAPGKWHTGELRVVADRDPRRRPGRAGRAARSSRRCSAWRRAAAPRSTKFSSGQVAIAGGSRGLTGAVRMSSLAAIRAGAGYATVAVPADLEAIFEQGQPEVMSVGCPGGDGCLAPASAKAAPARLRGRRRRRPRPRARPRPGLGRAGPRGRPRRSRRRWSSTPTGSTPSPATRRRSPRAPAPTVLTPHAGELGRLLGRDSERGRRHRLACAREAAARGGRGRRPQGRRHDRHRRRAAGGQRRSRRPAPGDRRAPATCSPGSSRRCSPAASSPSPRPARRSSPTPAPGATPPRGSAPPSR